jgi:peptide/nickel transport system substrate-binding protein
MDVVRPRPLPVRPPPGVTSEEFPGPMPNSPALRRSSFATLALCAIAACTQAERSSASGGVANGGTLVVAANADPYTLLPPAVFDVPSKQVVDLLFDRLADIGTAMNTIGDTGFTPRLARSWRWSADSGSVIFSIDSAARWHDGEPVRASDVKFSYEFSQDPKVQAVLQPNLPRMDSITTPDSLTAAFHFARKSTERFYQLVFNLWIIPKHLLDTLDRTQTRAAAFGRHPVGSGPYRFVRWEPKSLVELAANETYHRGRPHIDRVIWSVAGDPVSAANKVVVGEADLSELVRPETQQAILAQPSLRTVHYESFDHGYLLFNLKSASNRKLPHPVLGDLGTRRALALAINRSPVIRNAYDTLVSPSFGPFAHALWSADTSIHEPPFDSVAAGRMLDSLGWTDRNRDGVRDRNGVPLKFAVAFPNVSNARRKMAVVLQDQFKRVGADVELQEVDPAVLGPRLMRGDFDAFIHLWGGDPSPSSVVQAWGSGNTSSNFGSYSHPLVDSLAASVMLEGDVTRARAVYHRIYDTIVNDVPALFMWEPKNYAVVHRRIKFDALRADGWWMGIPDWYIPLNERIARDNTPVAKR